MPGHKSNTLRIFQSTPSARRATSVHRCSISGHIYFNPRPPRGGRLHRLLHSASRRTISIHALREEGDYEYFDAGLVGHGISIHALREEGDGPAGFFFLQILHFNPRPPRGGRQRILRNRPVVDDISIHALREEGDHRWSSLSPLDKNFNPRPPRGGRRQRTAYSCAAGHYFNPRPPRGGRPVLFRICAVLCNFNPRPPRGGRLILSDSQPSPSLFQSTPSARRATLLLLVRHMRVTHFNPRPPRGGRPALFSRFSFHFLISIHALREEGDALRSPPPPLM